MFNLFSNPLYLFGLVPLTVLIKDILRHWRAGVIVIIFWLYFQDVIRKLLPGQPPQVMLITDALVFLTYLSFFVAFCLKPKKIWKPPFIIGFLLFAGWSIIESFNPQLPNLLFAGLGLHTYIWYVPLLFLGYYMFEDKESLLKFLRILVYTSIPLFLVAVYQYQFYDTGSPFVRPLLETWQFHAYAPGQDAEGIKFITSVFAQATRYARFSLLLFFLGLGLWFYPKNKLTHKILLFISTLSAALGIFLSGARIAMFLLILGAILWAGFYFKKQILKILMLRLTRTLVPILAILLIVSFFSIFGFKDIAGFFIDGFKNFKGNIIEIRVAAIPFAIQNSGLLGSGTGSLSQGSNYIFGGEQWIQQISSEKGAGASEDIIYKVWFDLGFIGVLLFLIFYSQMFIGWLKEVIRSKGTPLYSLSFSLFFFFLLMTFWFVKGHQIFGETITQIHFWFFMGVLFRLKYLASNQQNEKI